MSEGDSLSDCFRCRQIYAELLTICHGVCELRNRCERVTSRASLALVIQDTDLDELRMKQNRSDSVRAEISSFFLCVAWPVFAS